MSEDREHGIRHKTSRRWLTEDETETTREDRAARFPNFDAADTARQGVVDFADAYAAEPFEGEAK